ncbi:(Fe-S)-binding protein [Brevibacillus sp. SYP-B805]|uniref:(Fe-S)-binding protein n=1 Tax=Brevibacillus sp. SYP-B805 TaxID=1578199 RepID=UPI0032169EB2
MQLTDKLKQTLDYEELSNCMRCGFCQPACPTFRETGYEAASPRGRIALMKAVADGLMEPDQDFLDQMSLCLGCRACEPVCPAGVHYGQLLEQTREAIAETVRHPWWVRMIRSIVFTHLLPHQHRLYRAGRLLRFYQRSGLQKLVRRFKLLKLLPAHLREMEAILPEGNGTPLTEAVGTFVPAEGERRGRVGMFRGCIMDVMFHDTNVNTVKLLARAGYDVVIPPEQTCCGALHAHSGERPQARELAKRNIRAFQAAEVDYIASNAGGCGALLQEYDMLLEDDREWREAAGWFASRVRDISELLLDAGGVTPLAPIQRRITYQGSCHLRNGMHVTTQPQRLLQAIPGAEYVPLFEADRCCGSAGIYNLVQPQMAGRLLQEKMEHVSRTKADILATSNPGCLLQMKAGIHRAGLEGRMTAVHLVDLLAEACREKE